MRTVTIQVKGLTPYSASRPTDLERQKSESHEDFDKRIWREKAHFDANGNVFIPGVCFKLALDEVAALLNEKIKGKGNQTYGKVISTGTVAMTDMFIGVKKDQLQPIMIYANLDGKRGGSTRGNRYFPIVTSWIGEVEFHIFNDELPAEIFERYFTQAGLLIGVGRGRPGMKSPAGNGRFQPVKFEWAEIAFKDAV
jgi:hypothetical protein